MTSKIKTALTALALAIGLSASANAALYERKILHFNGPESRTECVQWASGNWPWGGGWKTCSGHKYQFLNHEFFLVADGPQAEEAVKRVVQEAAVAALAAGVTAAAATPGEVVIKTAAALTAAKQTFYAALSANALTKGLGSQYSIRIDHRTSW